MVLGTDAEIEPLLEEWRMDLSERDIDIRKTQCQIVHIFDRFMILGIPTGVSVPVVETRCSKSFDEAERRIKDDKGREYETRTPHHKRATQVLLL